MGIALALPGFALHFLQAHLQAIVVLPELERHVDGGDKRQTRDDGEKAEEQNLGKRDQRGFNRLAEQGEQAILLVPDHPVKNPADQQGLEHRLDQLGHALPGKHARQALDRVDAVEIELEGLGGNHSAADHEGRDQGGGDGEQEDRRENDKGFGRQRISRAGHERGIERRFAAEAQPMAQQSRRALRQPATENPEGTGASGQHHEGHQFPRLRNVALFARLFQAPR
jgi:hypothetical protein